MTTVKAEADMESKERAALVEQLAEIFSERRLPGTRNGPITEPRDLAEYVVAALVKARGDAPSSKG